MENKNKIMNRNNPFHRYVSYLKKTNFQLRPTCTAQEVLENDRTNPTLSFSESEKAQSTSSSSPSTTTKRLLQKRKRKWNGPRVDETKEEDPTTQDNATVAAVIPFDSINYEYYNSHRKNHPPWNRSSSSSSSSSSNSSMEGENAKDSTTENDPNDHETNTTTSHDETRIIQDMDRHLAEIQKDNELQIEKYGRITAKTTQFMKDFQNYPLTNVTNIHKTNDIILGSFNNTKNNTLRQLITKNIGNDRYKKIIQSKEPLYRLYAARGWGGPTRANVKRRRRKGKEPNINAILGFQMVMQWRYQQPPPSKNNNAVITPGRFLLYDEKTQCFNDIGDKKAIFKCSEALYSRFMRPKRNNPITSATSPPLFAAAATTTTTHSNVDRRKRKRNEVDYYDNESDDNESDDDGEEKEDRQRQIQTKSPWHKRNDSTTTTTTNQQNWTTNGSTSTASGGRRKSVKSLKSLLLLRTTTTTTNVGQRGNDGTAKRRKSFLTTTDGKQQPISKEDVTFHDVVYGIKNSHRPGNQRYRELIQEKILSYHGKDITQEKLAEEIIRHWREEKYPPGRYLEHNAEEDCYYEVNHNLLKERTMNSLQYQLRMDRKVEKCNSNVVLGDDNTTDGKQQDITSHDVVYGIKNSHRPGNQRYRKLIQEIINSHHGNSENTNEKIVEEIIRHWREEQDPPGRYLEHNAEQDCYYEVNQNLIKWRTLSSLHYQLRKDGKVDKRDDGTAKRWQLSTSTTDGKQQPLLSKDDKVEKRNNNLSVGDDDKTDGKQQPLSKEDITSRDVVYGIKNKHRPGNQQYRKLIQEMILSHHGDSGNTNEKLAEEIIRHWREEQDPPGRYLEHNAEQDCYYEVNHNLIKERTLSSLHYQLKKDGKVMKRNNNLTVGDDHTTDGKQQPLSKEDITSNDVVYGMKHMRRPGNQRYRKLIQEIINSHHGNSGNNNEKLVKEIIRHWREEQDPPGRYLEHNAEQDCYYEVNRRLLKERTLSSLQYQLKKDGKVEKRDNNVSVGDDDTIQEGKLPVVLPTPSKTKRNQKLGKIRNRNSYRSNNNDDYIRNDDDNNNITDERNDNDDDNDNNKNDRHNKQNHSKYQDDSYIDNIDNKISDQVSNSINDNVSNNKDDDHNDTDKDKNEHGISKKVSNNINDNERNDIAVNICNNNDDDTKNDDNDKGKNDNNISKKGSNSVSNIYNNSDNNEGHDRAEDQRTPSKRKQKDSTKQTKSSTNANNPGTPDTPFKKLTELATENDVLIGRGHGRAAGTVKFRQLCSKYTDIYRESKTTERNVIVENLVREWRSGQDFCHSNREDGGGQQDPNMAQGRFLRYNPDIQGLDDIGDEEAKIYTKKLLLKIMGCV